MECSFLPFCICCSCLNLILEVWCDTLEQGSPTWKPITGVSRSATCLTYIERQIRIHYNAYIIYKLALMVFFSELGNSITSDNLPFKLKNPHVWLNFMVVWWDLNEEKIGSLTCVFTVRLCQCIVIWQFLDGTQEPSRTGAVTPRDDNYSPVPAPFDFPLQKGPLVEGIELLRSIKHCQLITNNIDYKTIIICGKHHTVRHLKAIRPNKPQDGK